MLPTVHMPTHLRDMIKGLILNIHNELLFKSASKLGLSNSLQLFLVKTLQIYESAFILWHTLLS